jgi:hypothetical protein
MCGIVSRCLSGVSPGGERLSFFPARYTLQGPSV